MDFDNVWHSENQYDWNVLLKKYWSMVRVDNVQLEYSLSRLRVQDLEAMSEIDWYHFLHDKYFVWKYTAKNRLATTRGHLAKYRDSGQLETLDNIRKRIIQTDCNAVGAALSTVCEIKGLGVAGASGLLSLIYPHSFATVDQFVVKALLEVNECRKNVQHMAPESLSVSDGIILMTIIREKAASMNVAFGSDFWTPRTLEMALWAYRVQ